MNEVQTDETFKVFRMLKENDSRLWEKYGQKPRWHHFRIMILNMLQVLDIHN